LKTELLSARQPGTVGRAAELLREGQAVALPTETVYGLAADATREDAVLRVFQAKSRPRFDPLIVHLPDASWVDRLVKIEDAVRSTFDCLRNRFWPGPLTFVFTRHPVIVDIVTAGLETVAVRLSSHPVFAEIVRTFGGPIAAPSANRFGRISPTTAEHVREELDGLIPLIVDGGPSAHGLESTIVALRNARIEVLRRGPITAEQLAEFGEVAVTGPTLHPEAPGQLPSHYAPRTPLVLVDDAAAFACPACKRCGLLGWNTRSGENFSVTRCLSSEQSLTEAATNLFRSLRELDSQGLDLIVAEKLPDEGLGAAINDRLSRAATKL
jgi:L-threonylcarbamoyladenylate synthase